MKKSNSFTWRVSFAQLVALLLSAVVAVGFAACANTEVDPGTSGETHFLNICTNGCGGLQCACDVCTTDCTEDADCTRFGAAAKCVTKCTTGKKSCDVPCTVDPDCAALGNGYGCVAGVCRIPAVPPGLVQSDAGVVKPGPGAGKGQFARCNTPPPSSCTLADTCLAFGCGDAIFDTSTAGEYRAEYDALGCQRHPCSVDADCGSNDRCTAIACKNYETCVAKDNGCDCGGVPICEPAAYCNPVAGVGPRGDWVSLEVRDESAICPPGYRCGWWQVSADGGLAAEHPNPPGDGGLVSDPISSRLSSTDLEAMRYLVNGSDVRAGLRDRYCDTPIPEGVSVTMTLTLSTGKLSGDITSCIYGASQANVFMELSQILSRY